jgi:hypothetical protein
VKWRWLLQVMGAPLPTSGNADTLDEAKPRSALPTSLNKSPRSRDILLIGALLDQRQALIAKQFSLIRRRDGQLMCMCENCGLDWHEAGLSIELMARARGTSRCARLKVPMAMEECRSTI